MPPFTLSGTVDAEDSAAVQSDENAAWVETDFIEDICPFYLSSAQTVTFTLAGPSTADLDMYIMDADNLFVASEPGNATSNETATATLSAGSYYILVSYYSSPLNDGPYAYTVTVSY